ncbi:MAG: enoyl-CoA hydratase-related protein [Deinococcales bacterium]
MANHDHEEMFSLEDIVEQFQHISYEIQDEVAIVTLRRPKALNALNAEVLMELGAAIELSEGNAEVRALIFTGEGRAFIAGADISELENIRDNFMGREQALLGQDVMNSIAALPIPTIAAVNGFALGGGLELALACDLRVAHPTAKMGLPEVSLGIIPGYGGTQRLPRLIGQGRALDLIYTGRHVPAEEALQLGLVNRVSESTLETAKELAKQCIKNAPIALGLAKEAVVRGLDMSLSQGLEVEADLFGMVATTADAKEGMMAFLAKRPANFQGQ